MDKAGQYVLDRARDLKKLFPKNRCYCRKLAGQATAVRGEVMNRPRQTRRFTCVRW